MFLFLFTMMASATPIIAPDPGVADVEYRAFLTANPGALTPTDALLNTKPSVSARENMVRQFADAQSAFLQDSPTRAREAFEQLMSQVHKEDWSQSEREAFFVAALRRAQLATGEVDRSKWIKWAISLGFALKPDSKLFPPPVMKEYEVISNSLKKTNVRLAGLGNEWTLILINGVRCSLRHCPTLLETGLPVRVTYVSDRWQPITVIMPLSEISSHIPQRKAWIGGDCQKPTLDRTAELKGVRPFFGMDCEESQIAKKEINFQPTVAAPQGLTMFEPPKKERAFYKSPWLWAGVGAVVAILVVQSQQNKKDDQQEPSTTYGLQ